MSSMSATSNTVGSPGEDRGPPPLESGFFEVTLREVFESKIGGAGQKTEIL
ncbi:MAG: hypothetical protein ACOYK9_00975 [Chlamydiia bacterium]